MSVLKLVTYIIRNASTPEFLTKGNSPVAPNSPEVKAMKASAPVLRITGEIRKGDSIFKSKSLILNAEKYRHTSTRISVDANSNTVTITVPEFKQGRRNAIRKVNAEAASVKALAGFFKTAPIAEPKSK